MTGRKRIENELNSLHVPHTQYGQVTGAGVTQGVGTRTTDELRRAQLAVCTYAEDEDVARELLGCLGLLRRI